MEKAQYIKDKWFIFLIIAMGIYLIIKIIERSNILFVFPFDYINDITSYMARLFFLAKYGFHGIVPNWFNGQYVLFMFSGPGWYYFTLPIYYLTKNLQSASYISMILMYIIGLVFFFMLGKASKFSKIKTVAFYLLFFASPIALGNFIRLGKVPEMFGWVLFVPLFTMVVWYKEKKLTKWFLLLIPLYVIILLSSSPVFLLASIMIVSLFLVKTNKERFAILLAVVAVAILTAFWWYPYITNASQSYAGQRAEMMGFLFDPIQVLGDTIASFAIMPIFFLICYFYLKSRHYEKKELTFLLPSLILGFVFFTRIIVFIPMLNKPHADSYNFFFLFLGFYFFLKTSFKEYPKIVRSVIMTSLVILPILMVIISQLSIPQYIENTQEDRETLEMMSFVGNHGSLVILGPKSYTPSYYAYGAINYDTRTTGGYAIEEMSVRFIQQVENMEDSFNKNECAMVSKAEELNLKYIITYREHCEFLKSCGMSEVKRINQTCLYQV